MSDDSSDENVRASKTKTGKKRKKEEGYAKPLKFCQIQHRSLEMIAVARGMSFLRIFLNRNVLF